MLITVFPSANVYLPLVLLIGLCRILDNVDLWINVLVAPVSKRHCNRIPLTGAVINDNGDGFIIVAEGPPSGTSVIGFLNIVVVDYNLEKYVQVDHT
jgi:hypothetical protein